MGGMVRGDIPMGVNGTAGKNQELQSKGGALIES
jgi:hypothetical protein